MPRIDPKIVDAAVRSEETVFIPVFNTPVRKLFDCMSQILNDPQATNADKIEAGRIILKISKHIKPLKRPKRKSAPRLSPQFEQPAPERSGLQNLIHKV